MDKIKRLCGSRKFWAALVGLALVVVKAFRPDFPLAEEQVTSLVYVLVAYILGVALEDGLSAGAARDAASEARREAGRAGEQALQAAKAYHVRLDRRE